LSLQSLLYATEKVRIAAWDSTELKPKQVIPAISRELKVAYKRPTLDMFVKEQKLEEMAYIEKGAVTMEGMGGEQIPLEKADIVIMNPPFTRQQRIPKEYKRILAKRFSDEVHMFTDKWGIMVISYFLPIIFLKTKKVNFGPSSERTKCGRFSENKRISNHPLSHRTYYNHMAKSRF
ncbi:MAG: hypothetical protein QMD23_07585, partial [Candidatus Bathyarchaeia archaeon]|nr:hypothetical protein [Candidatus Bathyarchaeia archaeon]